MLSRDEACRCKELTAPWSVREIQESFPVRRAPPTPQCRRWYRLEVKKALRRIKKIATAPRVNYDNRNRNGYYLRGIGLMRPGVTLDRVQQMAEVVAAGVRKNFHI